jgi:hypothetical protein
MTMLIRSGKILTLLAERHRRLDVNRGNLLHFRTRTQPSAVLVLVLVLDKPASFE